ncbi:MAG: hypothetical protein QW514_01730 [Thermoprotei archaeon]
MDLNQLKHHPLFGWDKLLGMGSPISCVKLIEHLCVIFGAMSDVEAEKFPVDENLKQLKGKTIYKTEKWWKAAVLTEGWGKRSLTVYLWQSKNNDWRVVQKYKIHTRDEWAKDKEVIEELIQSL